MEQNQISYRINIYGWEEHEAVNHHHQQKERWILWIQWCIAYKYTKIPFTITILESCVIEQKEFVVDAMCSFEML